MNIAGKDTEGIKSNKPVAHRGSSFAGSQWDTTHMMKPMPDVLHKPSNVQTDLRVMQVAMGQGRRIFETPQQLAISAQGYEAWCRDNNWSPSYAGLAYYLNIAKSTLSKYTKDKEEYTAYTIWDTITNKPLFSTPSRDKLNIYISRNYIIEESKDKNSIIYNGYSKSKVSNKSVNIQELIDKGEYKIMVSTTTFADVLEPIANWIEMFGSYRAENARNPSWWIWLSRNAWGNTSHYVDRTEQVIEPKNPIDEASDEDILKAAKDLPE